MSYLALEGLLGTELLLSVSSSPRFHHVTRRTPVSDAHAAFL